MAIVQISKMQQRAGNLVDLPQLDNGELGWASDANRLFIGRTGSTYSSENIEVLTSYSTVSLSQISGSDGGNLNINAAENGQILTYVASTNTWENYTGNSDQLSGGKLNLGDPANITMTGGAIGYVLQTDGTGNLSWTGQTGGNGGGGAPGGANTSVQFNDAGVFGGSANLSFNKTTRVLNVVGNIVANNFVGNLANGTTSIRISPTSGNLTFTAAGNTAMTILTGANVGIGTTNPNTKLQVIGTIQSTTTTNTGTVNDNAQILVSSTHRNGYFQADGNASGSLVFSKANAETGRIYYDNTSNFMAFGVNGVYGVAGVEKMRIDSNGNVGIGTTTPAYKLEINDENNTGFAIREYSNVDGVTVRGFAAGGTKGSPLAVTTGNSLLGLRSFGYNGSAWGTLSGGINIIAAETFTASAQGTYITFATTALGTTTAPERVRINPDGNVGIGNSSPSYKLDVSGTGRFTGLTQFDNAITLKTATLNYVYFDDAVAFARNGTGERMRIDSGGNVGIGTSSPTVRLDTFGGYMRLRSNTTINADISGNVNALVFESSDGTGEHAVIAGGNASNNFLSFYTANSAAPLERMRIDSSGNVGIGTNLPTGKLEASVGLLPSTSGSQVIIERLSGTTSNASYLDVSLIRDSIGTSWTTSATRLQQKIDSTWMGFMQFNGTTNQSGVTFGAGTSTVSATSIPEYLYLTSGGNVGIGTSTVGSRLVVNGGTSTSQIRWEVNNADYTQEVSTNAAQNVYVYKSNDALYHLWKLGGTTAMTLDSNLRLLINLTTSKTYGGQLQVVNSIQAIGGSATDAPACYAYDFNALDATPTYSSAVLRKFGSTAEGNLYFTSTIAAAGWAEIGGINVQSGVAFGANGEVPLVFANSAERMRIDSSGNVQIGSATATAAAGLRYLDIYNAENTNGNSGAIVRLVTSNVASNTNITVDLVKYKNGAFVINNNETNAAAYTAFGIGASERMRINSSGNVGIGVVPSSLWGSTAKVLQIGSFSAFYENIIGYPEMSFNSYEYSGNAYKYLIGTVNRASLYSQRGGAHAWYLAPIGTAGDVITYTQAMIIRTTGAVAFNGSDNYGSSGQVLTSQADAPPIWTTVASSGGTVTSVSGTGTVNGLTLSGTVTTTGSLTLGGSLSGSLAGCTVDGTNQVGFLNIPQNSQNQYYTCVLADAGKHIFHPPGGGSGTYEIPPNSSVAYPLGTAISFVNLGSIQNITCSDTVYLAGTGTTGVRVLAQYGTATAIKIQTTAWIISGTGLT